MDWKIVFGLTLPVAQNIKETMEKEIARRFPDFQSVCRYRREGIYQYVKQQKNVLIIIEEYLQGMNSYPIEEIQKLVDLGNNRIIFLADHNHKGDEYIKALYCCGIYDGLYLEEATPKEILKLIQYERTNEQARYYYGIQTLRDIEKAANIVNEEQLDTYMEYLEEETDNEELGEKYRFVSKRLGIEENKILAANLASETVLRLQGNEVFEFYKRSDKGKRRLLAWGKKRERELKLDKNEKEEQKIVSMPVQENIFKSEDEIFDAIDRFWEMRSNEKEVESEQTDLLLLFGRYLKKMDV